MAMHTLGEGRDEVLLFFTQLLIVFEIDGEYRGQLILNNSRIHHHSTKWNVDSKKLHQRVVTYLSGLEKKIKNVITMQDRYNGECKEFCRRP